MKGQLEQETMRYRSNCYFRGKTDAKYLADLAGCCKASGDGVACSEICSLTSGGRTCISSLRSLAAGSEHDDTLMNRKECEVGDEAV
jgi:hypothetical protein